LALLTDLEEVWTRGQTEDAKTEDWLQLYTKFDIFSIIHLKSGKHNLHDDDKLASVVV